MTTSALVTCTVHNKTPIQGKQLNGKEYKGEKIWIILTFYNISNLTISLNITYFACLLKIEMHKKYIIIKGKRQAKFICFETFDFAQLYI